MTCVIDPCVCGTAVQIRENSLLREFQIGCSNKQCYTTWYVVGQSPDDVLARWRRHLARVQSAR